MVWWVRVGVPGPALQTRQLCKLGNFPTCPEPQCLYQYNEDKYSSCLVGLFSGVNEIMYMKHLVCLTHTKKKFNKQ